MNRIKFLCVLTVLVLTFTTAFGANYKANNKAPKKTTKQTVNKIINKAELKSKIEEKNNNQIQEENSDKKPYLENLKENQTEENKVEEKTIKNNEDTKKREKVILEEPKLLDKKIGQMIIVGFEGDNIYDKNFIEITNKVKNGDIGGVIYFKRNMKSKKDVTLMNEVLYNASKVKPFIALDNEGGAIQRHDFELFKSAKEVSKLTYMEAVEEYSKMSDFLLSMGFNFNFAPVVDLELNPNSIISQKERSYSSNPDIVTSYARIFIKEHNRNKIITSIKHFPGHGSIDIDTHKGFADATNVALDDEILPYENLKCFDELNTVMVSHIFNSKIDDKFPASLSKKTVQDLLIDKIGFNGVVVSDDYDMGAIKNNYTLEEIVVNAINAGVDILIFSNNIEEYDESLAKRIKDTIIEQIKEGKIKQEQIDKAFNKIMILKRNMMNFEKAQN